MSATGSIAASNANLGIKIDMAVLRKINDVAKSQGDAAVSLLQNAADLASKLNTSGSNGTRLNVLA